MFVLNIFLYLRNFLAFAFALVMLNDRKSVHGSEIHVAALTSVRCSRRKKCTIGPRNKLGTSLILLDVFATDLLLRLLIENVIRSLGIL